MGIVPRSRINRQLVVLVFIAAFGPGCVRDKTTGTTPRPATTSTTSTTLAEAQRAPIEILAPTAGAAVSSPLTVSGTANTYEATLRVSVVDSGYVVLADQLVTATSGSGTRGTFSTTLDFRVNRAGPGRIVAYEESAEDGSRIHVVEVRVNLIRN